MLPCKTMQAAEDALGRRLTAAEWLWFAYSADKDDLWLYCHSAVLLILSFSLASFPLAILELRQPHVLDRYKLQPNVRLTAASMIKCYKDVVCTLVFAFGPLQLSSYPVIKWIGIRMGLPLPSGWEVIFQILVYFLIEDYVSYWIHRLILHSKWGYDKIHRVHHEFTAPMGFVALHAHWAELLLFGFSFFMGPALVPCHIITFWVWMILRQMEAIDTHSGYDFPRNPTNYIPFYGGAEYHDYHHYVGGQIQSNFASVFPYCDYLYGTNKGYRYKKKHFNKGQIKEKLKQGAHTAMINTQ